MRGGTIILLAAIAVSQSQWREDGRCGADHPLEDGTPGECDPGGNAKRVGPCCSPKGFCGNTKNHCNCANCIDFSKLTTTPKSVVKTKAETLLEDEDSSEADSSEEDSSEEDSSEEGPEVRVQEGLVRGRVVLGEDDRQRATQFWGVPYAEPPTGKRRFLAPVQRRPWTGTLDARQSKHVKCPQMSNPTEGAVEVEGQEDCLYLNIFAPGTRTTRDLKAVMVWIHGGAFTQGAADNYLPLKLVDEGVIVVTLNYRLGTLGFLTFGNRHVQGNMGLRDQALAIQWVRDNIRHFGGDPDRVTLFGESAGGMSVHAQVLSPYNHGKLAGAIAQSGTMLTKLYQTGSHPRTQALARRVSGLMACGGRLDGAALACLQGLPLDRLVAGTSAGPEALGQGQQPMEWGPVVDSYAPRPFLPLGPLQAMKEGKFNRVPFISGTMKHDGALFLPFIKPLMAAWPVVGPQVLPIKANLEATTPEHRLQAGILWQYYNHPAENRTADMCLADMLTDGLFLAPDQTTVRLMSKFSDNIYNYQVTQPTTDSVIGKFYKIELNPNLNPGHGDDIPYLFDILHGEDVVKADMSEEEASLSKTMLKLWTSFAKSGQPLAPDTVDWEPVTRGRLVHLELVGSGPVLGGGLQEEAMLLWRRLVWGPREDRLDRRILYEKATALVLGGRRLVRV